MASEPLHYEGRPLGEVQKYRKLRWCWWLSCPSSCGASAKAFQPPGGRGCQPGSPLPSLQTHLLLWTLGPGHLSCWVCSRHCRHQVLSRAHTGGKFWSFFNLSLLRRWLMAPVMERSKWAWMMSAQLNFLRDTLVPLYSHVATALNHAWLWHSDLKPSKFCGLFQTGSWDLGCHGTRGQGFIWEA